MKKIFSLLQQLVEKQIDYVVDLRHKLHQIPEPGFEEIKTAAIISAEIKKLGLNVQTEIASTGIIADLITDKPGGYVLLRADMDALAIKESTGAKYTSLNPEFAHSCGHDGHCAALIGTARILTQLRNELRGRIRFLFQPAEEICRGAQAMIDDGALENQLPDAAFSAHAWPGLDTDCVAAREQAMMASCDVMNITVIGKGGHGARPNLANNPLLGTARIIEALTGLDNSQRIVSLCVARIGKQANVIANRGKLSGTVRALDPKVRKQTLDEITSLVENACQPLGLKTKVTFDAMSPAVINNQQLYRIFRQVAGELLGPEKVITLEKPSMGSEDFGCYLQHVPGLLFRVGMGQESDQLHQSHFDFNDKALRTAMLLLSGLAVQICCKGMPE
ncbi:MAG: M20 metallopeptidase family protein [Planctomycetota bacterium]|jgi:amidohydrolase